MPFWQDLSDAIPQHAPQAQAKVERVRHDKRDDVVREVDHDGAITLDRQGLIAVKPGARRRSVAARVMIDMRANRFDR